jgi:hypothetical protein
MAAFAWKPGIFFCPESCRTGSDLTPHFARVAQARSTRTSTFACLLYMGLEFRRIRCKHASGPESRNTNVMHTRPAVCAHVSANGLRHANAGPMFAVDTAGTGEACFICAGHLYGWKTWPHGKSAVLCRAGHARHCLAGRLRLGCCVRMRRGLQLWL